MKKYFLFLLLPIFFGGCEKSYNNVVDNQISYNVESVISFDKFVYSVDDSLITVNIKLSSSTGIKNIVFDIYSSDNKQLNESPVKLYDNGLPGNGDTTKGDNIYSNKFPLSRYYPFGIYTIEYFITDINDITKQVAVKTFEYDNGQTNSPPVLSNLVMPDSVKRGVDFIFTITASDSNGLNDIKYVFFSLYKPDGSQTEFSPGQTTELMHDDGSSIFGDAVSDDGIFSYKNSFAASAQLGTWRFEFQATDRRGKFSNKIIHNMLVQ